MKGSGQEGVSIVAFDLDGTLLRGDTFVPFLLALCGWSAVPALAHGLAAALRGGRSRLKAVVARRLFEGLDEAEVAAAGRRFADRIAGSRIWVRKPVLLEALRHKGDGQLVGVVTASPEIYTARIAAALDLDFCLGTRLASEDGKLTGDLDGPNCRGRAKVERLRTAFPAGTLAIAYGDSHGDHEMVAAARAGYRVSRWWRGRTRWVSWE